MGKYAEQSLFTELFVHPTGGWARIEVYPTGELTAYTGTPEQDYTCQMQGVRSDVDESFITMMLGSSYKDHNPPVGRRRKEPVVSKHIDCSGNLTERFVNNVGARLEITTYSDGEVYAKYLPIVGSGTAIEVGEEHIPGMIEAQHFEAIPVRYDHPFIP